jgi:hypothetical protein
MANKYDAEMLLADVRSIVADNFNTKVAAINAEKNDGISLDTLNSSAFFMQQLNGNLANYNPICFYSLDNIETVSSGPLASHRFSISVLIIAIDTGEEVECGVRMLRYLRALEEIFKEKWNENRHGIKLQIQSLVPIPLTELNSTNSYRATGVVLEGSLG